MDARWVQGSEVVIQGYRTAVHSTELYLKDAWRWPLGLWEGKGTRGTPGKVIEAGEVENVPDEEG